MNRGRRITDVKQHTTFKLYTLHNTENSESQAHMNVIHTEFNRLTIQILN